MYELGCSVADITPKVGIPLSGFIFRENKPSTGVDTPLFVRVLAIRSDSQLYLLLNYDLLGLGVALEQQLLAELEQSLGVPKHHCLLVATHTHSAPPAVTLAGEATPDPAYWRLLSGRSVEAARAALARLEPVTLHQASLRLPDLTYNRRAVLADGRVSMALKPDAAVIARGPVDDELTVLAWQDQKGRNVAAALHFACHGVAVCTQAIGGDIPGELAQRLEALLGVPCLYLQGAAGDINPLTVSAGRTEMLLWVDRFMSHLQSLPGQLRPVPSDSLKITTTDLLLDYTPLPSPDSVEQRILNLDRIAQGDISSAEVQDAVRSLGNIMNFKPGEPPDLDKAAYAAMTLAQAERRILAAIETGRPLAGRPLRLAIWRLGKISLAFVAAELFAITGLQIKALRPDLAILPVTYLAPLVGYVPDRAALAQGGYEVDDAWRFYSQPAPFAPDSEQRIVTTLAELIA